MPNTPPKPPASLRKTPLVPSKRAQNPYKPPKPTARQQQFLDAIATLTEALGRPPSAIQVAAHIGVTRSGATRQLQALEHKGFTCDVPKTVSSGQWALTAAGSHARRARA